MNNCSTVRIDPVLSMGRFPSGQRGQTVNLLAKPSEVQILPSPFLLDPCNEGEYCGLYWAGIAQLVEHQPSKLRVAGSNPVSRSCVVRTPGPT